MRKKLLAAAAVVALLLSAGCGRSPAPKQKDETDPAAVVQIQDPSSSASAGSEQQGEDSTPQPGEQEDVWEQPAQPVLPEQPRQQEPEDKKSVCTVSISCGQILKHMDWLDADKAELVPADGWLLPEREVELEPGESAFELLLRLCRENRLHMEYVQAPVYGSAYVEGIGNLYEFDCGEGSGWMYSVNGEFPNVGCSQYVLKDADRLEWVYTCEYGADLSVEGAQG